MRGGERLLRQAGRLSRPNELADCVKRSLERYFKDMDGEKPTSIYEMVLKNIEKPMIETVLGKAEGNQSLAAEMLGVTRNTLRKKMQQLRIKG
jgi:Fis family transcriptional regulator